MTIAELPVAPTPSPHVVYASDTATVICGDAAEVLATMPTGRVDLLIADPPYGVRWQSNRRPEKFAQLANDGAEDRPMIAAVLAEAIRVLRSRRHLYSFGPADVSRVCR